MNRFALIAAATALMAAPTFAQTANETAEEILNADADTPSEVIDGTLVQGAEDCDNPAAEVENESTDATLEEIDCVTGVEADGTHEELELDDDEGVSSDG
ncbi:hypothetical protein [Jannaschia sp. CCS1]|uniref:hypothetical protein n=1 Tax=Jannaschia sp. (strain CCS1) TaxID=290400 RepID=UPI000053BFD1|nr:hypothetical protein [Jannaschia sp. CCS1]ABD52992.1 hypothetical protein Jann_0075 [Jannaschia sp. CCS1]